MKHPYLDIGPIYDIMHAQFAAAFVRTQISSSFHKKNFSQMFYEYLQFYRVDNFIYVLTI